MSYLSDDLQEQISKMKFVVYLRKSSQDNEDKQLLSIEGQMNDIQQYILDRYNIKPIKVFRESKTAFKPGRPRFNEMIEMLENGVVDGSISWHANRYARNYGDGGRLVQLMTDGKLSIVLTCSGHFIDSPRDKEYLMNEFSKATRDSGDKSIAVKRGNKTRFFDKKWWIGRAKPGYLNTLDPVTKERIIVVDDERFPMIQDAIKLILYDGRTPMQALDTLNEEWQYKSRITKRQGGRPMAKSGWYRLLGDPYYYGLMIRSEGEQMSGHQTMISKDEYDRLQIILGKNTKPHRSKRDFPYKTVVKCGGCDGSITAEERWQVICSECKTKFHRSKKTFSCKSCGLLIEKMKNPKILHYVYFHCAKKTDPTCTEKSIEIKDLENQIDSELKRYEIPEVFKDWAIKYLNEINEKETNTRQMAVDNAQKALDDVRKKKDNLVRMKMMPQNSDGSLLSDDDFADQMKIILEEKESLQSIVSGLDKRQDDWHELSIKTFNFACYAREWFGKGDVRAKTDILGALGSNLTIKGKKLRVEGENPFLVIAEGKQEVEKMVMEFEPTIKLDLSAISYLPERVSSTWLGNKDSPCRFTPGTRYL